MRYEHSGPTWMENRGRREDWPITSAPLSSLDWFGIYRKKKQMIILTLNQIYVPKMKCTDHITSHLLINVYLQTLHGLLVNSLDTLNPFLLDLRSYFSFSQLQNQWLCLNLTDSMYKICFIDKRHKRKTPSTTGWWRDTRRATYKDVPSRSRAKRTSQGLVEIMRFSKEKLLLLLKVRQSL